MKSNLPKFTKTMCTACNKPAIVTKHTDKLPGGVEHTYFQCEECGHKATVCYTDAEIRAAMMEQREVFKRHDEAEIKAGADRLQGMMDELKGRVDNAMA